MYYFYLFLIYSVLGWLIETIYTTVTSKKFVNRGFLLGPYCPIYGTGAMCIIFVLKEYKDDLIILFLVSAVLCSIIEYITSYIMEKLFHARWWDYSLYKFNLNGRICLLNSVLFGLLGVLLISFIHPKLNKLISLITNNLIGYILLILFIIDTVISFKIILKLTFTVDAIKKDYTGEITEMIRQIIYENSKMLKRLVDAFPHIKILKEKKAKK